MTLSRTLKQDLLLFTSFLLLELSVAVMPMAMYMKGDRPFTIFLTSKPGIVFVVAIIALLTGPVLIQQYLAIRQSATRHLGWIAMMNLIAVLLLLITVEIIIRENSNASREGETFLNRVLLPKNWGKVAHRLGELIDPRSGQVSYMVYDSVLGWTVAPNKRSADGLYLSNSEGIRAPSKGLKSVGITKKMRIALVGDSVTFGNEVSYEDSWGYLLEKGLGSETEVLNFGVAGYAVDQAYLRYEKDVRKYKPKIVIYGLMSGAVMRTLMVYPFVSLPNLNLPFSKPRFIIRDGKLNKMNVPVPAPETIFSKDSIFDLPFIQYDAGYKQSEWRKAPYHLSYLARLCVSIFPRWSIINPDLSDMALMSVNTSILKAFIGSITQSGAIPIVVYFPQTEELATASLSVPIGKRVLDEANIGYTDLTPCLLKLNPSSRLVPSGGHYSPQGNAAIANCLRPIVNQALAASRIPTTAKRKGERI